MGIHSNILALKFPQTDIQHAHTLQLAGWSGVSHSHNKTVPRANVGGSFQALVQVSAS